ncbi:hypothetical protein [Pseudooceanicola sp. MF1-13]|uniref:hypothetical protein n=1 Tax=Pseudooceanicola sp. MF1-13 TaxID=3379095 RepID=UPI003891E90E
MRTTNKALGLAAILATVSTGAVMAQDAVKKDVPASLEDSRLIESTDNNTVTTFTESTTVAESAEDTQRVEAGADMSTEVATTMGTPASLEDSRLAEANDITEMNADGTMYIWNMSEVEGASMWADDDAVMMRQAILDNAAVKAQLEAEGYTEADVVSAYTNAEGGLTILVDG